LYQANSVERPGTAGQPHDDGNGIAVDPNTIPAKATSPTLDLPVNPPTVEATTPYPGPPAADTQGLCYDANGTVECSPEQLQQFVEDSKRLWEVLPEWVRQDCKTYREPKIIGCVLVIERAWFAAHPGEPIPGWMKPWGVGDQANGSFPSMDRNGVRPLFVALRQHRLFCPGGRTRRRAPGALRGSWGQS
jgi:hypothetical protein